MIRGPIHRFFISLVFIVCVGSVGQTSPQSAPVDRTSMVTFHVNAHQAPVPMKVVRVTLGDKEIPLDTPVPLEGMWMRTISVTLQNVSSKTIVECAIAVDFPETFRATNGPVPSIPMRMGRRSAHGFMRSNGAIQTPHEQGTEVRIPPGASVTFKTPEGADWDQAEAYKLVDPITKVSIDLGLIFFNDESKWAAGQYFLAVPPPEVWRNVSADEFNSIGVPAQP